MKMWPIRSQVNSPENDDEAFLKPIEPLEFGARGRDEELPLG